MKNSKTKVLYIHHSGAYGGAPKSMSYIIKNLDLNSYDAKLINIAEGPINDFFREQLDVPIEVAKGIKPFHGSTVAPKKLKLFLSNYLYVLPSFINAYKILKRETPDLLHLNSTCLFVFAIAAKILGIPVISHVREPLRRGLWGAPLRYFIKKNVNGVIAISEYDLNSLRLGKSNILNKVIYNFVEKFDNREIRRAVNLEGIFPEDIVLLYLARFAKGNGWENLIDSAKKITAKNPKVHFILAGATATIDRHKFTNHNIHIIPFQQDVEPLLHRADIYVCPFTEPHFARGIIEASAFSLPIIGTNIGGVNELVVHKKTGYLYNTKEEFDGYVTSLVNDEARRIELGKAGYEFAFENFNMKKNLADTYHFYKKVLGR